MCLVWPRWLAAELGLGGRQMTIWQEIAPDPAEICPKDSLEMTPDHGKLAVLHASEPQ